MVFIGGWSKQGRSLEAEETWFFFRKLLRRVSDSAWMKGDRKLLVEDVSSRLNTTTLYSSTFQIFNSSSENKSTTSDSSFCTVSFSSVVSANASSSSTAAHLHFHQRSRLRRLTPLWLFEYFGQNRFASVSTNLNTPPSSMPTMGYTPVSLLNQEGCYTLPYLLFPCPCRLALWRCPCFFHTKADLSGAYCTLPVDAMSNIQAIFKFY